jgi:hypothetical protein
MFFFFFFWWGYFCVTYMATRNQYKVNISVHYVCFIKLLTNGFQLIFNCNLGEVLYLGRNLFTI